SLSEYVSTPHQQLKCPCWPSLDLPFCRTSCEYKIAPDLRKCKCVESKKGYEVTCTACIRYLECKIAVINAKKLSCLCTDVNKDPSQCLNCRVKLIKLLAVAEYPTCVCKDIYSTEVNKCRPFCKIQLNKTYDQLFSNSKPPTLTAWKIYSKPVLPICDCWEPNKSAICTADCKKQLSVQLRTLYHESCPCNEKNSLYQIDDKYCWVFRCFKCKQRESN